MSEAAPVPTRVTVTFPDGPVTLMLRRAPVGNSGPIRGRSLAVLPVPGEHLRAPLARLVAQMVAESEQYPAVAEPDSRPATAIVGLTADEAAKIGAAIGLTQVFHWDGRRASLLDCPPASRVAKPPGLPP